MGTTIRTYGLGEKEIRGERFTDSKKDLKNNGDLYSLTQAGDDLRHPPPLSRSRRGHHRDEHLFRHEHRPERILRGRSARARRPQRPGVLPGRHRKQISQRPRVGDQRAVRQAMPRMGRPHREPNRPPALRRRRRRAADGFAVQFTGCGRRRLSRASAPRLSRRRGRAGAGPRRRLTAPGTAVGGAAQFCSGEQRR